MNLDPTLMRNIVAIQPGSYKVVFRSREAKVGGNTCLLQELRWLHDEQSAGCDDE